MGAKRDNGYEKAFGTYQVKMCFDVNDRGTDINLKWLYLSLYFNYSIIIPKSADCFFC